MTVLVCSESPSQVFLTKQKALSLFFSDTASIRQRTIFLTDNQVSEIQERAKSRVTSKLVTYYVGRDSTGMVGYAFFETHVVRTMPETILILVDADGSIRTVELLAFFEPEDYKPPDRWLALLEGKSLQSDLWLKRGVHNIVGATLTAEAITANVRRTLATFEVAVPKEG